MCGHITSELDEVLQYVDSRNCTSSSGDTTPRTRRLVCAVADTLRKLAVLDARTATQLNEGVKASSLCAEYKETLSLAFGNRLERTNKASSPYVEFPNAN